jgi:FKBP-type peptidyl-prolyl cis-trans isomerase
MVSKTECKFENFMKYVFILALACLASASTFSKKPKNKKGAVVETLALKTPLDSFSYAFGSYSGSMLNGFKIDSVSWKIFQVAFEQSLKKGDSGMLFNKEQAGKILNTYITEAQYGKNKADGIAYINKRKAEGGFTQTPSGLLYKITKPGNGVKSGIFDTAMVYYLGKHTYGKTFDSNIGSGQPFKTALSGGAIAGFLEALLLMDEGAEAEIIVPYDLAYGKEGMRNPYTGESSMEPYMTLVFILKLDRVIKSK